mmetsp:Transcript_6215/g.12917  ORF Transcript_6215/g.12917 Transcript_6215/m.12917 type:complete len:260 (+) Transcript_6215:1537-2316(+)
MSGPGRLGVRYVGVQHQTIVCDGQGSNPMVAVPAEVVPRLAPEAIPNILDDVHDDLAANHPGAVEVVSVHLLNASALISVRNVGAAGSFPLHKGDLVPPLGQGLMHSDAGGEHEEPEELNKVNAFGRVAVCQGDHLLRLGGVLLSIHIHTVLLHRPLKDELGYLSRVSLVKFSENLFQLGPARPHDVQVRLKTERLFVAAENVPLVLDRSTQDVAYELHVDFGVVLRRHARAYNPIHVYTHRRFVLMRLHPPHDHVSKI